VTKNKHWLFWKLLLYWFSNLDLC